MKRALIALLLAAALVGCGQESAAEHNEKLQSQYNAATAKQYGAECELWRKHCTTP